ncbi:60S ribosomal protein L28-like [Pipistrellus kuhlii]|uniref:60S ribosomal protein L28-like n=1 Tax=Pipistrellus kuhlii TaxID=59472 RepID=UPI00174F719E|nr:60S ribosomal protein L28-like [Pipistrellus kuhlii]
MPAHLQWMTVRNCSSFLVKRSKQTYSTEPSNLKARHSLRHNGLTHRKAVGMEPAPDGNARAALSSIRRTIRKNKHRPGLRMAAVRRASAILRSHPTKSS